MTLIELIIGLAIVAILTFIAVPAYNQYVDKGRVGQVIHDIGAIQVTIQKYHTQTFKYPDGLQDVGMDHIRDPWGQKYRYLNIIGQGKNPKGARTDRNLKPLNKDYDLYSIGKDGATSKNLRPQVSHDDIIRANSGGYIGLASEY